MAKTMPEKPFISTKTSLFVQYVMEVEQEYEAPGLQS